METQKRKNTNTRESRSNWDKVNLASHHFKLKKDSELNNRIANYKKENPGKFSNLVKELLEKHFELN